MAEELVQRRLAAILVADVVSYSRLMERDGAGMKAPCIRCNASSKCLLNVVDKIVGVFDAD